MSISINWSHITSPPAGPQLAEQIRAFIHTRFQTAQLPRFIRSVAVQGFELGTVPPELEIKDLGDPLGDFYESDEDDDDDEGEGEDGEEGEGLRSATEPTKPTLVPSRPSPTPAPVQSVVSPATQHPLGVPGGTSNLSYFHQPLGSLSGTQTPLAAVASGSTLGPGRWAEWAHVATASTTKTADHDDDDAMFPLRPATATTSSVPGSPPVAPMADPPDGRGSPAPPRALPAPTDLQVITHVKYSGDMRLTLTAEILLDYPMPSFASIPVTLAVTGVVFDGVAVLAWCRGKLCFCFLGEAERRVVLEGEEEGVSGGVLREVRVESEIGERGGGKTVLKNVGKVEKFVLERVRGMIEEELVFPSFWTFLI